MITRNKHTRINDQRKDLSDPKAPHQDPHVPTTTDPGEARVQSQSYDRAKKWY